MYKIFHNIDGEKTTVLKSDSEFINFVNLIQNENEDNFILRTVTQCKNYLEKYCDNLDLITENILSIKDLKEGDKFYSIFNYRIDWYIYMGFLPNSEKYHILIDKNSEPFRVYHTELQKMLDKNLKTYQEAKLTLADIFEEKAKNLRSEK